MSRSTTDALLGALGERVGLPGLRLDDSGCCQLAFDRRWLVTIGLQPSGQRLVLHCPLASPELTASLSRELLLALLDANFLNRGAGPGTLAVGPDRRVCVQVELPLAGADANLLHNALEHMLNVAQVWAERLEKDPAQNTIAPARAPAWMGNRV